MLVILFQEAVTQTRFFAAVDACCLGAILIVTETLKQDLRLPMILIFIIRLDATIGFLAFWPVVPLFLLPIPNIFFSV